MTDNVENENATEVFTHQEQDLAAKILNEFFRKNYSTCIQLMSKLENRSNDFKVLHNRGVIEYYKSSLRETAIFESFLESLCSQFNMDINNIDDIDHCIVYYNIAVLLYNKKQYAAAIEILDKVQKFIEPMDIGLAKQVSLLAIELQLSIKQPDKALSFIHYVENVILNGTENTKNKSNNKQNIEQKRSSVTSKLENQQFKNTLFKYKLRCSLMKRDVQAVERDMKEIPTTETHIYPKLLSANLEYIKRQFQKSENILTSISPDPLLYEETGDSWNVILNNNLGVLHCASDKLNLASYYFQAALKEDIQLINKQDVVSLYSVNGSKYHEIVYNLGICLLFAKKPKAAFEYLAIAVRRYHRNCRLWLRLAECCIMVHKRTNEIDFCVQDRYKDVIKGVIGKGQHQKLIISSSLSKNEQNNNNTCSDYAVPTPTLEFASLCLRNALHLVTTMQNHVNPLPLFVIPGSTPQAPVSSPGNAPCSPLTTDEITLLRNTILVDSSYVALCLNNHVMALRYAKQLLDQAQVSNVHTSLAQLYLAETLASLDNLEESESHISLENIKGVEMTIPPLSSNDSDVIAPTPSIKWFPDTLNTLQIVAKYNLAVIKTLQNRFEEAIEVLYHIRDISGKFKMPSQIIMLAVYIELKSGNVETARSLLKQYIQKYSSHARS